MPFSVKLQVLGRSEDTLFVEGVQKLLIFSLPMIVCYFVEQLLKNVLKSSLSLLGMGLLLVASEFG